LRASIEYAGAFGRPAVAGLYAAGPGPEPLVLISVRPLMDHEGAAFLWLKTFIRGEFANGLVVEAPEAPCARPGEEGAGVAAVIVVPREKCRALAAGAQAKPHSLRPTHFCRRTGMATRTPVAPHPARGARPPPRPTGSKWRIKKKRPNFYATVPVLNML